MKAGNLAAVCLFSLAVIGFVGCSGSKKETGNEGGEVKTASKPEDAVKYMEEAAKTGNFEGVIGQFAAGPREVFRAYVLTDTAEAAWGDALDQKFPPKTSNKRERNRFKDELLELKSLELLTQDKKGDDKVVLKLKITVSEGTKTDDWLAVKENGAWKLIPPMEGKLYSDSKEWKKEKEVAEKKKGIYEKATLALKDNVYKTRQEAEKAFWAAWHKELD